MNILTFRSVSLSKVINSCYLVVFQISRYQQRNHAIAWYGMPVWSECKQRSETADYTVQSDISLTSFKVKLAWAFSFPAIRLFRVISLFAFSSVRCRFFKRFLVSTTTISSIFSRRCVGTKKAVNAEIDSSGSSFKRVLLYLRRSSWKLRPFSNSRNNPYHSASQYPDFLHLILSI